MTKKIFIKKPQPRKVFAAGYSKVRFFKKLYRQKAVEKLLADYTF